MKTATQATAGSLVNRGSLRTGRLPQSQPDNAVILQNEVAASMPAKSEPAGHVVTMGGVAFKVVHLLLLVEGHGGAAVVTELKLWKSIAQELGVNTKVVHNASTRLRVLHEATVNRLRSAAATADSKPAESCPKPRGRARLRSRTSGRPRTLEERSEKAAVGKSERRATSARRQKGAATARSTTRRSNASTKPQKASSAARKQDIAAAVNVVRADSPPTSAQEIASHPFFSYTASPDPVRPKKSRAKKTKGGTKRGLQKGLQSVSCAVALPDEVQDDVNELTRKETLAEYLAEFGVEKKNLDKVLESYPQLQHLSVIQNLRPTVRFLTKEIGIAPEMVRKVIVSFPQILGLSVDDNLRPTARYLLNDVGVPMDRLNKTIVTRPQILGCSVEKNLRPKLELLVEMAGIEREQLPVVVARAPHVLGYSPSNIAQFLIFLLHELRVDQKKVARLLATSPQLLGLSVENNIRPKIRFLVEEVGITNVGQVIGSFPNILGYSVENNMRPKLEYLSKHILKVPMSKLGRPLEKCPQLLGYSLEKRIKPRHLLLANRGLKLGLSRMLAPTDLEFRRILRIHDAQLQEERRAQQVAASAIRAYSWAADGNGCGGQVEVEEEVVKADRVVPEQADGSVRRRVVGARSKGLQCSPAVTGATGALRDAEVEAEAKASRSLAALQRQPRGLMASRHRTSLKEVRLSEMHDTSASSESAPVASSHLRGRERRAALRAEAPTYYWH
jgi:mTERF domain-containing protein